jgi:hypothetical protein
MTEGKHRLAWLMLAVLASPKHDTAPGMESRQRISLGAVAR